MNMAGSGDWLGRAINFGRHAGSLLVLETPRLPASLRMPVACEGNVMTAQKIPTETTPRPTLITVLCVLNVIGTFGAVSLLFTGVYETYGIKPMVVVVGETVGLAITVGLWKMQRWAAIACTAELIIGEVVLLFAGHWGPIITSLVVWSIMAAICLAYYPKMR